VPQAVQMKAGMRAGYTRVAVDDHFLLVKSAKNVGSRGGEMSAAGSKLRRTQYEHMFFRFALELGHCSTQSAFLKGAKDRDRGEPRGSSPPTPPYVRVRIRRFEKLR